MAMFLFSLVPVAIADNDNSGGSLGQIRDKVEDVKDEKEDTHNISNIDRINCVEKCKTQNGINCEARCRLADARENVRDLRGDMREKRLELVKNHLENKEDRIERFSNLSQDDLEKISALNRARLKEISNLDKARIRAELGKIKILKIKSADDFKKKNLSDDDIAELKDRFENAKERYKNASEEFHKYRKELADALHRRDNNATIGYAKQYLLSSADAIINNLEKIKAKVQENENIPNATEASIVAEIDAHISDIASIKAQVEAATTKEQIKDAAKKLNDDWKKLKELIKLYTSRIISARVEGIVNFGLVLEKRLDKILEKANESGIQLNISSDIDSFSQKIADSKDKYKQAQDKIKAALDLRAAGEPADSDKIKALLGEAKELLKQSRNSLKDAHEILKAIVKKIKGAMPHADLSSEEEVEITEENSVGHEDN